MIKPLSSNRQIMSDYIDKQFHKELNAISIKRSENKLIKKPKKVFSGLIEVYTDGGCSPNDGTGIGTWSFVIIQNNQELARHSGASQPSTNNKMEITAATRALEWLRDWPLFNNDLNVLVYTDSKYLINGISEWMVGWQNRGWKTSTGDPVKNKDEWQALCHLICKQVKWEWVKGHQEDLNSWNNVCDELCTQARLDYKRNN